MTVQITESVLRFPTLSGATKTRQIIVGFAVGRLNQKARMVNSGYCFRRVWLLHFSCCLLGELREPERSRQVEGLVSSLTLMGARRITSAMWDLVDLAAAEFARHWIRALNRHVFSASSRQRAYAVALKEATSSFRSDQHGRYDHEVFWAPITLFGVA